MIAMALALEPRLMIADEPTTALDVTIQAQVLELISPAHDRGAGTALILITHDLGVVAGMTQRINVMYAGFIVGDRDDRRPVRQRRRTRTRSGCCTRSRGWATEERAEPLIPIEGRPPDSARPDGLPVRAPLRLAARPCAGPTTPALAPIAPGRARS